VRSDPALGFASASHDRPARPARGRNPLPRAPRSPKSRGGDRSRPGGSASSSKRPVSTFCTWERRGTPPRGPPARDRPGGGRNDDFVLAPAEPGEAIVKADGPWRRSAALDGVDFVVLCLRVPRRPARPPSPAGRAVQGTDYTRSSVPEREVVSSCGAGWPSRGTEEARHERTSSPGSAVRAGR